MCDDFLLIGTDDGASGYTTGKPSLLSFDPKTGELLSSYKMNVTGDIRSSITHYNGKYYFTSKGGYFFEASVDAEGNIEDVRTLKLYNYADDPAKAARIHEKTLGVRADAVTTAATNAAVVPTTIGSKK